MEITSFALNNFAPENFFGEAKFVAMNTPQKFQECRFRLHCEAFSFVERKNGYNQESLFVVFLWQALSQDNETKM